MNPSPVTQPKKKKRKKAAASKALFTESTEVSPVQSAGEITQLLVEAGARAISTNYRDGDIVSLSFTLPNLSMEVPYLLPVRVEPVFHFLQERRRKNGDSAYTRYKAADLDKAKRIAWRQLFWWLKAQLALIGIGMVETAEVMLPYMLGKDGRSFFDTYKGKMLESGGK